jgi:hypothetical protein
VVELLARKRRGRSQAGRAALVALTVIVAAARAAQAQPCRISGTVFDPSSRAGIAGASVALTPGDRTTRTDEYGRFEFRGLRPSAFNVSAEVPGFAPSAPVPVDLTAARCDVVLELEYRLAITTDARADQMQPALAPIAGSTRTLLDSATITNAPGGLEDVFRALQGRPGVAASDDNRNDLLVRGGGAIENQTRVDGFDIPNPNHFGAQAGTGGGLSIIAPWLIRDATLEAGGFSVSQGERISSALDVAIRSGRTDLMHAAAGASAGGAMALLEGPLPGRGGAWLVSARRSFLELVFNREKDRVVPTYADVLAKVDLAIGRFHSLTVLGLAGRDGIDVQDETDSTDKIVGSQTVGLLGLRLDSHWRPGTFSTVTASVDASDMDVQSWHNGGTDGQDRGNEIESRVRVELRQHTPTLGDITAGVSLKHARLRYDLRADSMSTPYSRARRNVSAQNTTRFTDRSAFVDITRPLPLRLRATAGVRVDYWAASRVTSVSPRIKSEFAPRSDLRLVAGWGVYRQGLPYIWLGSELSNLALAPIDAQQADAGVDLGPWKSWRLAVGAFDKRYRNYPVDLFEPARVMIGEGANFDTPFVGKLASAGRVRARGIDLGVNGRPVRNVVASAGYSYWRVSQAGLDGVWRRAENELRHQVSTDIRWQDASGWSAGLRWRYVAGRPYTPYDPVASAKVARGQYDLARINGAVFPAYHRLDLRVDKTFQWGSVRLVVFAEVDNLYDRDNVYVYRWNNTLKKQTAIYQWGRTPVAGLRIEY